MQLKHTHAVLQPVTCQLAQPLAVRVCLRACLSGACSCCGLIAARHTLDLTVTFCISMPSCACCASSALNTLPTKLCSHSVSFVYL